MSRGTKSAEEILSRYWGYDNFRPLQREIIDSIIAGEDTLALMPTGGGKSITYQVPALMRSGICIVITPLISLMIDQVERLKSMKIAALALHSGMTARELDITLDNAMFGNYKFLYVSPERVATKLFIERFKRMNVSLIAVDEAHCISQWGYDFRPSYLRIAALREHIPTAPLLAVTATATSEVATDIMDRLLFMRPNIKRMSFARGNISYIVRSSEDKDAHLLRVVGSLSGSAIVYCRKRMECERVAAWLTENGHNADFYHGGLDYHLRKARQREWIEDKTRVVVATNAFGMGIDKADVRFVVHYDIPESIEAYYQEAGRAGRDGKEAFAVLLTSEGDCQRNIQRIESAFPTIEEIHHIYNMVCNYLSLAIGDGRGMPFDFNIYDFASKFSLFSGKVRSALKILELNGYITLTEEMDNPARIMFVVSRDELYHITIIRTELENFIRALLRLYPGLFSNYVAINIDYIASQSGYTPDYIREALKSIMRLRIINYIPARRTPLLIFHEERLADSNLRISPESYAFRLDRAKRRYQSIDDYATTPKCRALQIRHYFDEQCSDECGKCDICRSKRSSDGSHHRATIEKLLSTGAMDLKVLIASIRGDKELITSTIRQMVEEEVITLGSDNTLQLTNH